MVISKTKGPGAITRPLVMRRSLVTAAATITLPRGVQSLFKDTTGGSNTATGYLALYFNTTGNFNTATGRGALYKNTASNNTALGYAAGANLTTGSNNIDMATSE